jgi:nitric oxide reductase large subunit
VVYWDSSEKYHTDRKARTVLMRIVATLVGNLYDVDVTVTPEEDHTDAVNAVAATMVGVGVGIAPGLVGADGNPIERDEFWTWFMAAVVRAGYVLA